MSANRNFFATEVTKHKWLPTEVFSRMTGPKNFTTGATDAKMYADRSFSAPCATERVCNWREWCKNERRPNIFLTDAAEAQVSADGIVFVPGATENFNDWRERCKNECRPKFFRLVRPKQNSLRAAFFLQLRWPKHEQPPTKAFLLLSRQKIFRLAWPKQKFPPTKVYLRLARP